MRPCADTVTPRDRTDRRRCRILATLTWTLLPLVLAVATGASAQSELTYDEYLRLERAASGRLLQVTKFEPLEGETGMLMAFGSNFNAVHIYRLTQGRTEEVWKSRPLDGFVQELLVTDMDGDGLNDALVSRNSSGRIYVWALDGYRELYVSLPSDYIDISCFTAANMDDDPATELVVIANSLIHYIDGITFNRQWTSLNNYEATQMRCGDVDGDGQMEIVLNTGQVLDGRTGNIEWEDYQFNVWIELLDMNGDGVLDVITSGPGQPLRAFAVNFQSQIRFQ